MADANLDLLQLALDRHQVLIKNLEAFCKDTVPLLKDLRDRVTRLESEVRILSEKVQS